MVPVFPESYHTFLSFYTGKYVMALLNFDVSTVEPSQGYELLPPGKYLVEVTASEEKPIKDNKGSLYQLEFTILEGDYKNWKLWSNFCCGHIDPKTAGRGKSDFAALCIAANLKEAKYTEDVHNIPVFVNVRNKADKVTGELRNEINNYSKYESQFKQPAPPSSAPVNNSVPPWKRS
jgi:hypothetical protein